MSVSADGSPRYTLISFATAWGPQHGGINAFNADLLEAVAAAYWRRVESVCVVLVASEEEIRKVYDTHRIILVPLGCVDESRMPTTLEPRAWDALTTRLSHWRIGEHTVWLGHDRITGPIALEARRRRGGKSALIHHMSYERYEAFAEGSQAAEIKRSEQTRLFKEGQHIFAVGPLLKDALSDLADRSDGHLLIPGLAEIEPRKEAPKSFKVFLSGRLSAETRKIKQAHLGLAGFGHAVALCDNNRGFPDALKGEREPGMRLRGVDFEHEAGLEARGAESELRAFVESHARRVLPLSLLPFTQDRQTLFQELRQSSVALMPSWHEGFGLVAWEAVAAGVPLIVSRKSGVYRLLEERGVSGLVLSIDPRGSNTEPFFRDEDRDEVADTLIQVAKAPDDWRRKASELRQRLLEHYTWPRCAQALVAGLGWPPQFPAAPATPAVPVAVVPAEPTARLLEMPSPRWQAGHGLALSQLLRAEERVVPFDVAASSFFEEQLRWITGADTPSLSVRLLTGRGGAGKTRLALELCRQLHGQGWDAGLLPNRSTTKDVAAALAQSGCPCLVVVDYAETRQQQVLDLLKHLLEMPPRASPVRLLLLARAGGDWWAQFPTRCRVCEALLLGAATSGPYEVPPLHEADADRLRAYRTALHHFASRLQLPMPEAQPDLSAERFAHPLHLQMTALLALHGEAPVTAEALIRALLAHEKRYWMQATSALTLAERDAAAALMNLSTLCGGFAVKRDAEKAWQRMGLDGAWLGRLWGMLQPLYPGTQGLDAVRPDLLGETLAAQALLGYDQYDCLGAVLNTGSSAQRRHALTVLARVLRARDDVAPSIRTVLRGCLSKCAQEVCEVGLATPSPLTDLAIAAFEAQPEAQRAQVAGLMRLSLREDMMPLTRLAVAVNRSEKARAEARWRKRPIPEHRWALVAHLHDFSIALHRDGQGAAALEASQMAWSFCDPGTAGSADLDKRGLSAQALSDYANFLADHGRHEEALARSKEALELRRKLAGRLPERFEPYLAASLSNHAIRLAEQGRHEEALALSKEALELHRKLAGRLPERFEPDLTTCLNNHAIRLAKQGQHEEALALSKEALEVRRKLARRLPERFEPDLASSLGNYAIHLAEQGRHEEALALSKEALELHRKLAGRLPERFEPDLATSLNNHANHLAEQGWHEEALALSKEALELQRKLAGRLPERFEPVLARVLLNHAGRCADSGDWMAALAACGEAVSRLQGFERFQPRVHGRGLGDALLWIELLNWIRMGREPGGQADIEAIGLAARDFDSLTFQRAVVDLLFAATMEARDLQAEAQTCLRTWGRLDQVQTIQAEEFMLAASAVLSTRGLPPLEPGWLRQWHRFADQHQGRIPQWMLVALQRARADPAVS